jgi:hypothetical protein
MNDWEHIIAAQERVWAQERAALEKLWAHERLHAGTLDHLLGLMKVANAELRVQNRRLKDQLISAVGNIDDT